MTRTPAYSIMFAATAIATCLISAGCSSSKTAATNPPASPTVNSSSNSSTGASASAQPGATSATTITIKNFGFTVSGSAAGGSKVEVTNNDAEAHTVTADSGKAFDVTIQPGKTGTFTAPAAAGSYKFHCSYHSNMHGALTVSK